MLRGPHIYFSAKLDVLRKKFFILSASGLIAPGKLVMLLLKRSVLCGEQRRRQIGNCGKLRKSETEILFL
jgi:hypothetical protein